MPHPFSYTTQLAPDSEREAFIIALAETGDGEAAERLVIEALSALGHTLPQDAEETDTRFFLLLISAVIDWHWQRRIWTQPFQRLLERNPPVIPTHLQQLPVSRRHAYLLKRLAPLTIAQIAAIVELPPGQVRHPAWEACAASPSAAARRRYRRRLRSLAAELRHLHEVLSPARIQRLREARVQGLSSPTHSEHQALYLWQHAMQRQLIPTGIVMLLLLISLFGFMLYF